MRSWDDASFGLSALGRGFDCGLEALEQRTVLSSVFALNHTVVELETTYGEIWIELLDDVAPLNVANFLNYVEDGDYDGSFFHRLAKNFVLQGGGFRFDNEDGLIDIPEDEMVMNEFNRSNLERTVAFAKLAPPDQGGPPNGGPNSATNQFFFNLNDNSGNLDNQNGGFTVFGQVVYGWEVVETIEARPIVNFGGAFDTTPVTDTFDQNAQDADESWFVTINRAHVIYRPGAIQAGDDPVPGGTSGPTGTAFVTIVTSDGRPIAFQQTADGTDWTVLDLRAETGSGASNGQAVSWYDSKDGHFYVAAPSAGGVIVYRNITNTQAPGAADWDFRNITTAVQNSQNIVGQLTTFTTIDGLQYIAGLNFDGELVAYFQTGAADAQGNLVWSFTNLVTDHLEPQELTQPEFEGPLTSYVTSWNQLTIAGLDANGDVQTVWWAPGLDMWTTSNLSEITGAPAYAQGGLTVFLTSWNAINLVGTNSNGEVVATWWVPEFGGDWETSNLTDLFDGPQVVAGTLSSYVTPWGGLNVAAIDGSGDLVTYWWAPGLDAWNTTNLTEFIPGSQPPAGAVSSVAAANGTINLFSTNDDGDVTLHFFNLGTLEWAFTNLTETATFTA